MYTIYDEEEGDYIKVEEPDHSLTYTYADYIAWNFKERLELFRGKIFKMGAPNMNHQVVCGYLFNKFYDHLKGKTCQVFIAPFDVRLPIKNRNTDNEVTTVVQPDICIFCDPSRLDDRGACGAPDLAIETLSPGNRKDELRMKYEVYEEAGVKEYWIADPAKKNVLVFLLQPDGKFAIPEIYTANDRLKARCIPELSINVKEMFDH
ncbi:MAG TPA: Uma2 family endonuclease [Puia sp.]|nr:Uma2 family endonuclease [Puia sp.]